MAGLKFSNLNDFKKDIFDFAKQTGEKVNDVAIDLMIEIQRQITIRTNWDTGIMRASWLLSFDTPDLRVWDTPKQLAAGEAWARATSESNVANRTGKKLILSNNVEYVGYQNFGTATVPARNFVHGGIQAGLATLGKSF